MSPEEKSLEIAERIRKINESKTDEPIPDSLKIFESYLSDVCSSREECAEILSSLVSSNYLFAIEHFIRGSDSAEKAVYSYVVTELPIIKNLKQLYSAKLQKSYESETSKPADAEMIIKELGPKQKNYRNKPLGRLLAIAIGLKNIEHVISNNFREYTDVAKFTRLEQIYGEGENGEGNDPSDFMPYVGDDESVPESLQGIFKGRAYSPPPKKRPPVWSGTGNKLDGEPDESKKMQRAVDTDEYEKLQKMDLAGSWGRAVALHGVEFLIRIHFRKYEFKVVKKLIQASRIAREKDLMYIRETLAKMMMHINRDIKLSDYLSEMEELRILALEKLQAIDSAKQKRDQVS